jgi:hypothetical protein
VTSIIIFNLKRLGKMIRMGCVIVSTFIAVFHAFDSKSLALGITVCLIGVVLGLVVERILIFLAEALELIRDQTQAAQAAVVMQRNRMESSESPMGKPRLR